MMMEVNCPVNLHATDGLGADNMTAIIIEFKKWKPLQIDTCKSILADSVQLGMLLIAQPLQR